jgi:hypothetical protein
MCGKALPFRSDALKEAPPPTMAGGLAAKLLNNVSKRQSLSAHRTAQPAAKLFNYWLEFN